MIIKADNHSRHRNKDEHSTRQGVRNTFGEGIQVCLKKQANRHGISGKPTKQEGIKKARRFEYKS